MDLISCKPHQIQDQASNITPLSITRVSSPKQASYAHSSSILFISRDVATDCPGRLKAFIDFEGSLSTMIVNDLSAWDSLSPTPI